MKYILFLFLLFSTFEVRAMYSFDDCLYLSDEVNAETPMDFNNGFILDYTTCMDFPSGPRLIYLYRVTNISKNDLGLAYQNQVKDGLCTNPQTAELLDNLRDVQYQYYDNRSGGLMSSFIVNSGQCR
ncbi:hypothetical protein CL660_003185 [bacterium]|nr:hypothetical protein [bacterium]